MNEVAAALVAVDLNADRLKGAAGIDGKAGTAGKPGRDGADGRDGTNGRNGEPGLIWRGPWSASQTYVKGDVVESEGSAYVATGPSKGQKPPSGSWGLLAQKGADGLHGRGGGGSSAGSGSALTVSDEAVALDAAVASLDFAGSGVTATNVGHEVTVTIPGAPVTSVNEQIGDVVIASHVYVTDSDPGALASTGDLWVDTTTPGPPWHVQIRNATDDGWEDLLEQYKATLAIRLTAGGNGEAVALTGAAGIVGDGGPVLFQAGNDSTGAGSGASLAANGGTASAGGSLAVAGGNGDENIAGGDAFIRGGNGNDGDDAGARFTAKGGDGTGNPGKAAVTTNGSTGPGPLVSDGTDVTYSLAAFVANGSTVDDLRDSLIAAGLMAAS